MVVRNPPMSVEDFLRIPEEKPALELLDGEIAPKMSPNLSHIVTQDWFRSRVNSLENDDYMAFVELRVNFAGASVVPDVSVFPIADLPLDADGEIVGEYGRVPTIVFEVVSPGQSESFVHDRCRRFVTMGVRAAVVSNPRARRVSVFRPTGESLAMTGSTANDLSDIVPGLKFTPDEVATALFIRPRRRP